MDLPQQPGISYVIAENAQMSDVVWSIDEVEQLEVMTAGPFPPSPAELLGSKMIEDLIQEARGVYDKIIIDAPPILHVTDAGILSRLVDGVIIVAAANQTKKDSLKQAKKALEKVNANLLGVLLTKVKLGYGSYYYHNYKNYYTKDEKKHWWQLKKVKDVKAKAKA